MDPHMLNNSAKLLQQITRDPKYVDRLSGAAGESPTRGGRSWDERFAFVRMPQYDALNDRFCKFSLRRKLPPRSASKSLAPKAINAPLAPLEKVWGARGAAVAAPGSWNVKPHTAPAAIESKGLDQRVQDSQLSTEAQFQRAKGRLLKLWDERGAVESERVLFAQKHFIGAITSESLLAINDEIQRLFEERNVAIQVERAIEVREGFLYLLQELTERYSSTSMEKDRALRELNALIAPFRNASLDVVEAIVRWREAGTKPSQCYLWKGVSYLFKMTTDLHFLSHSRLRLLLDTEVANNPFLDQRRAEDNAPGKLPPLKRGGKDAKDLPRDRIDRCERVVNEEKERLRQMSTLVQESDAENVPRIVHDEDEDAHVRVEEKAWLLANTSTKDNVQAAATKIQAMWKRYVATRFVNALVRQRSAVIKIQSVVRRFLAKLHAAQMRSRYRAAQKLQSIQRGRSTRAKVALSRLRENAATKIQAVYRGWLARRLYGMLKYLDHSATEIQRCYRGHLTRRILKSFLSSRRSNAAIRIQAAWRGFTVRSKHQNDPRKIQAAVRLQAWTRGLFVRSEARSLRSRRFAAVRLQSWWRGVVARRRAQTMRAERLSHDWERFVVLISAAALLIQSTWRMFIARRQVSVIRKLRQDVQVQVESEAFHAALKEQQDLEHRRKIAASKIQALARGRQGRNVARFLRQLTQCATIIQRVFRGHLDRTRAQHNRYQQLLSSKVEPTEISTPTSLIAESLAQLAAIPVASTVPPTPAAELTVVDVSAVVPDDEPTDVPAEFNPIPEKVVQAVVGADERCEQGHQQAAASTVTRFFRRAAAQKRLMRQVCRAAPNSFELVSQEMNFATRLIQTWARRCKKQPTMYQPSSTSDQHAIHSERRFAYQIIEREFAPVARANLVKRRLAEQKAYLASASRGTSSQERDFATLFLQRFGRKVVGRHLRRTLALDRHRSQLRNAQTSELNEAASLITRTLRRHLLHKKAERRRVLGRCTSQHQERVFAAQSIQRCVRMFLNRLRYELARQNRIFINAMASKRLEDEFAAVFLQRSGRSFMSVRQLARLKRPSRLTRDLATENLAASDDVHETLASPALAVRCAPQEPVKKEESLHTARIASPESKATRQEQVVSHPVIATESSSPATLNSAPLMNVTATAPPSAPVMSTSSEATGATTSIVEPPTTTAVEVTSPVDTKGSRSPSSSSSVAPQAPSQPSQAPSREVSHQPHGTAQVDERPPVIESSVSKLLIPAGATQVSSASAATKVSIVTATANVASEKAAASVSSEERPKPSCESTQHDSEGVVLNESPIATSNISCKDPSPVSCDTAHHSAGAATRVSLENTSAIQVASAGASSEVPPKPSCESAHVSVEDVEVHDSAVFDASPKPKVPSGVTPDSSEQAAAKIQRSFRCYSAKQELSKRRVDRMKRFERLQIDNIPVSQSLIANEEIHRQQEKLRHRAALRIQCAYRCYNARFMRSWKHAQRAEQRRRALAVERFGEQSRAIVKLQCFFRRCIAARTIQRHRAVRNSSVAAMKYRERQYTVASLLVQRVGRAYNSRFETRWRLRRLTSQLLNAAHMKLASETSSLVARQALETKYSQDSTSDRAALTIQCAWRGFSARCDVKLRRERHQLAEVDQRTRLLQRVARGAKARQQARLTKLMS